MLHCYAVGGGGQGWRPVQSSCPTLGVSGYSYCPMSGRGLLRVLFSLEPCLIFVLAFGLCKFHSDLFHISQRVEQSSTTAQPS